MVSEIDWRSSKAAVLPIAAARQPNNAARTVAVPMRKATTHCCALRSDIGDGHPLGEQLPLADAIFERPEEHSLGARVAKALRRSAQTSAGPILGHMGPEGGDRVGEPIRVAAAATCPRTPAHEVAKRSGVVL